jgi:hypothetical protein
MVIRYFEIYSYEGVIKDHIEHVLHYVAPMVTATAIPTVGMRGEEHVEQIIDDMETFTYALMRRPPLSDEVIQIVMDRLAMLRFEQPEEILRYRSVLPVCFEKGLGFLHDFFEVSAGGLERA